MKQTKSTCAKVGLPISSLFLIFLLSACSSDSDNAIPVETADTTDTTDVMTGTGTLSFSAGVLCDYMDVTFNDSESVNATSTSEWSCSDSERILTANGLPDHAVGTFPNPGNPNTIAEQAVSVSYTLAPEQSAESSTLGGSSGPQGYVLNGVKIDASTAGSCDDSGTSCSLIDNTGSWNIEPLGQSSFDFGTDF